MYFSFFTLQPVLLPGFYFFMPWPFKPLKPNQLFRALLVSIPTFTLLLHQSFLEGCNHGVHTLQQSLSSWTAVQTVTTVASKYVYLSMSFPSFASLNFVSNRWFVLLQDYLLDAPVSVGDGFSFSGGTFVTFLFLIFSTRGDS